MTSKLYIVTKQHSVNINIYVLIAFNYWIGIYCLCLLIIFCLIYFHYYLYLCKYSLRLEVTFIEHDVKRIYVSIYVNI